MTKHLSVAASLLLLVSNAAFVQHGGTEQEQRACEQGSKALPLGLE
jgi:hypothetical protein